MIATVNYHSSILLPWSQPTWTNTPTTASRRGLATHKPFYSIHPYAYRTFDFPTADSEQQFHIFKNCIKATVVRIEEKTQNFWLSVFLLSHYLLSHLSQTEQKPQHPSRLTSLPSCATIFWRTMEYSFLSALGPCLL